MFFAPPEVKSLSKYSEFGSYLGNKHFAAMLGLAIFVHLSVIYIYSMVPHQEVKKIEVRTLNIKLSGGGIGDIAENPGFSPLDAGAIVSTEAKLENSEIGKISSLSIDKSDKQIVSILQDNVVSKKSSASSAPVVIKPSYQPKKYVRASEEELSSKLPGNGSGIKGSKNGDEIVRRYEQEISLWVARHKVYPESAKKQGIEGNAIVRIRVNRNGSIIYSSIEQSSGNNTIDDAVMEMVRQSDPVPHIPDDYPQGSQLEFLIPVSFNLLK